MGNKLCAPLLKKNYRAHEANPWHSRKDSHLLRLWADVFRVHGDGEYMRWERVSEDVVPVNISCIEDTPSTVFLITAYNRQVEKIFDVNITQPGTIICPATECFVHWRDINSHCEWGLNFSTPTDAQRFRDCCSYPTQRFARKASSASSLRLSPPKQRQRSKAASASSPNSPVRHSNPVTSETPGEEGCEHAQGLTVISTHRHQARAGSSPTRPRAQNGGAKGSNSSPPPDYAVIQRRKENVVDDSSSSSSSFRKSIATSNPISKGADFSSGGGGGGGEGGGAVGGRIGSDARLNSRSCTPTPIPLSTTTSSPSRKAKSNSLPSKISPQAVANAAAVASSSSNNPYGTQQPPHRASSLKHTMDPSIQPSSAISDLANQKNSSSPKHVVISDIVSVNITGISTTNSPTLVINPSQEKPNGILKRDSSLNRADKVKATLEREDLNSPVRRRSLSESPPPPPPEDCSPTSPPPPPSSSSLSSSSSQGKSTLRVDTGAAGASRHTSSSESPEWPSPPEPLTPQTPQTPNTTGHMSFDSETIQRMLRSLPCSPLEKDFTGNETDLGFHEDSSASAEDKATSNRKGSRLARTKSLNVHDRNSKSLVNPRQRSVDNTNLAQNAAGPSGGRGEPVKADQAKPRMFNKIALERELKKRNKNIAANYPDSGIGLAGDKGSSSVRSDGSQKSAFSRMEAIQENGSTFVDAYELGFQVESDIWISK